MVFYVIYIHTVYTLYILCLYRAAALLACSMTSLPVKPQHGQVSFMDDTVANNNHHATRTHHMEVDGMVPWKTTGRFPLPCVRRSVKTSRFCGVLKLALFSCCSEARVGPVVYQVL